MSNLREQLEERVAAVEKKSTAWREHVARTPGALVTYMPGVQLMEAQITMAKAALEEDDPIEMVKALREINDHHAG